MYISSSFRNSYIPDNTLPCNAICDRDAETDNMIYEQQAYVILV